MVKVKVINVGEQGRITVPRKAVLSEEAKGRKPPTH